MIIALMTMFIVVLLTGYYVCCIVRHGNDQLTHQVGMKGVWQYGRDETQLLRGETPRVL